MTMLEIGCRFTELLLSAATDEGWDQHEAGTCESFVHASLMSNDVNVQSLG